MVLAGETFSFSLPYTEDEEDGDDFNACNNDLSVTVFTNERPEDISWEVKEVSSNAVLAKGGQYEQAFGSWYAYFVCLPDGQFEFKINVGEKV